MQIVVIGGGYVAQLVQLAVPEARLLDWRKTPPANHMETRIGPQYLWEPINHAGVQSHSFPVTTLVDGEPPTIGSVLDYKKKIGKEDDGGDWGLQFQHRTVGWHSELPVPRVEYDQRVTAIDTHAREVFTARRECIQYDVLVSTIPLNELLKLITVPLMFHEKKERMVDRFRMDPIYITEQRQWNLIAVDGMVLNYLSKLDVPWYRETFTGKKQFLESLNPLPDAKKLMPGKIHPSPESEGLISSFRVEDVHCFGRFAAWRPDELAHETWKQIEVWKRELAL